MFNHVIIIRTTVFKIRDRLCSLVKKNRKEQLIFRPFPCTSYLSSHEHTCSLFSSLSAYGGKEAMKKRSEGWPESDSNN